MEWIKIIAIALAAFSFGFFSGVRTGIKLSRKE